MYKHSRIINKQIGDNACIPVPSISGNYNLFPVSCRKFQRAFEKLDKGIVILGSFLSAALLILYYGIYCT